MSFPFWRMCIAYLMVSLLDSAVLVAAISDGTIVLRMKWLPQAQFAGYYVALEKGFYADEGIPNVHVESMVVENSVMEPLLDGQVDFCVDWLPNAIIQRDRGREVVCLMQLFQKSSLLFVAHRGSEIRSIDDLHGKPVQIWMSDAAIMPRLFLKRQGVEPDLIPLGSSLSPFLRKAVAAVSATTYNEYHMLIEGGVRPQDIVSIVPGNLGFDYPEDGLYCMKETFREHPELCQKVVRASLRGWTFALDPKNERETIDIIMRQIAEAKHITNDNHQTQMLRKIREFVTHRVGPDTTKWGKLSKQDYEHTVELLKQSEAITHSVPFEEFYPPHSLP